MEQGEAAAGLTLGTDGSFYGATFFGGTNDLGTVYKITPTVGPPSNKSQCINGGWQTYNNPHNFRNQGDCIQYVNTGK